MGVGTYESNLDTRTDDEEPGKKGKRRRRRQLPEAVANLDVLVRATSSCLLLVGDGVLA